MDKQQFDTINNKLDLLARLIATQIIQQKEYREQVILLHKAGLHPREIARITGKSINNIKVTLHLIKKINK